MIYAACHAPRAVPLAPHHVNHDATLTTTGDSDGDLKAYPVRPWADFTKKYTCVARWNVSDPDKVSPAGLKRLQERRAKKKRKGGIGVDMVGVSKICVRYDPDGGAEVAPGTGIKKGRHLLYAGSTNGHITVYDLTPIIDTLGFKAVPEDQVGGTEGGDQTPQAHLPIHSPTTHPPLTHHSPTTHPSTHPPLTHSLTHHSPHPPAPAEHGALQPVPQSDEGREPHPRAAGHGFGQQPGHGERGRGGGARGEACLGDEQPQQHAGRQRGRAHVSGHPGDGVADQADEEELARGGVLGRGSRGGGGVGDVGQLAEPADKPAPRPWAVARRLTKLDERQGEWLGSILLRLFITSCCFLWLLVSPARA